MKYKSTRGGAGLLDFERTLFSGYAVDGGLLVPVRVPTVDARTLKSWANLSYVQLAKEIVPLFIDEAEIPRTDLLEILDKSFVKFDKPEVVSLSRLSVGLNVLELFHGPTLAFKDLALSFVGQLYSYFLEKRRQHRTVLVGTSGDTGSAAIEAVKDQPWLDIIVLLPRGRCTQLQELQMTTVLADNVHVFRVDGSSDDLDFPIRECFSDVDFSSKHGLCSINSINWARILVQIVHFFYAYLQMCPQCDNVVEIVVPTGACGNVAAGCIARKMCLNIKLVCCVNSNDVVARLIDTGTFSIVGSVVPSLASAMDIQMAYNVERLLWLFSDGDTKLVRQLMQEFEQKQSVSLPETLHRKMLEVLSAHRVNDDEIRITICRCFTDNKYFICPHTATAVHYHYSKVDQKQQQQQQQQQQHGPVEAVPRVCVATASPAKFPEAMTSVGLDPVLSERLYGLASKRVRFTDMEKDEDWTARLKKYIEHLTDLRVN